MKERRLARARTCERANAVPDGLPPGHDRRFAVAPRVTTDCHRSLGRECDLASILSIRAERAVSSDCVVRWSNRHYQLRPPARPGLRGGRVVIARRRDGSVAMRFGDHELRYREIDGRDGRRRVPVRTSRRPITRGERAGKGDAGLLP